MSVTRLQAEELIKIVLKNFTRSAWGDEGAQAFLDTVQGMGVDFNVAAKAITELRLKYVYDRVPVGMVMKAISEAHKANKELDRHVRRVQGGEESTEVKAARQATNMPREDAFTVIVEAARRRAGPDPYMDARYLFAALLRLHHGPKRNPQTHKTTPEFEAYGERCKDEALRTFGVPAFFDPLTAPTTSSDTKAVKS